MEAAIAADEADLFWTSFDAGYQRLVADPDQWAEIQAERSGEATALADHL